MVFDLLAHTHIKSITVGNSPWFMYIKDDIGYVLHLGSTITLIDLKDDTLIKSLFFYNCPTSLGFYKNVGYYGCDTPDTPFLGLYDFKTNKSLHSIPLPHASATLLIRDDYAYVSGQGRISVVNLETKSLIDTFPNPHFLKLDFSDTHIYLGCTRIKKLAHIPSLVLFSEPYGGIEGDILVDGSGDEEFQLFLTTNSEGKFKEARHHFNAALAAGNTKAFAVAAYAFLTTNGGAVVTNLFWYRQFTENMDKDFYNKMINGFIKTL